VGLRWKNRLKSIGISGVWNYSFIINMIPQPKPGWPKFDFRAIKLVKYCTMVQDPSPAPLLMPRPNLRDRCKWRATPWRHEPKLRSMSVSKLAVAPHMADGVTIRSKSLRVLFTPYAGAVFARLFNVSYSTPLQPFCFWGDTVGDYVADSCRNRELPVDYSLADFLANLVGRDVASCVSRGSLH
jgi:hypothetical protein